MESIKHITDHLLDTYKFELSPPGLPVDKFNYYKMNLYLKLNIKVFKFLNKYFPVKYNKERLDKSIWFIRGDVETCGTLVITKGSKIIAEGEETDPIIFTSNREISSIGLIK